MALVDTVWYCNFGNGTSTGYYAVTVRPQNTAVVAGVIRRQFTAPAVGSERVFVCIVAGTTANVTDATWVLTRGAKTTDGTATWMECTGQAGLNGDLTNTATWTQVKAATPAVLGQVIKRSNNASYQICTTAGAMSASEPAFSDTAGVTTTDTTAVWTSLGPVANFTGGQAPFARLASACASGWFVAGNTVYVGSSHAESQVTAMTIAPVGSGSTIGKILCHNQAAYPPATGNLTTGATVSTTGAVNIAFGPLLAGAFYLYGLTFKSGIGQAGGQSINFTTIGCWMYFDLCSFELASTGATASIAVSFSGTEAVTLNNSTVKFSNVGQGVQHIGGTLIWQNTGPVLVSGSSVPTALITVASGAVSINVTLEALDLSQLTGNLVQSIASGVASVLIKDCKLHASTTVPAPSVYGVTFQLVRSSSSSIAYTSARYAYEGTETTETTIVRAGGATDPTGQVQSRKIVTSANAQWLRPFKAEPYAVWNATTGSITATIYGNAATLPLSDEIWAEFEFLGSGSSTLGSILTTTKSNLLATGASVASDASTWSGGTTPFKLTATLTPGQAGYVHARIRTAKASATYYIDPQIYLS